MRRSWLLALIFPVACSEAAPGDRVQRDLLSRNEALALELELLPPGTSGKLWSVSFLPFDPSPRLVEPPGRSYEYGFFVPHAQAAVKAMASAGLFDRATKGPDEAPVPPGRSYRLRIGPYDYTKTCFTGPVWTADLGWGPDLVVRLHAMKTGLFGDHVRAIEKILVALKEE